MAAIPKRVESNSPVADPRTSLERLRKPLGELLRGKEPALDAILSALLARGHVLLEDVPGVGKTTLVKAIARLMGLEMKRIQCTSDLLPSDIIGVEIWNDLQKRFEFQQGPLFAPLVLADELNRTSPRTQSALLEAMGEGGVTVDRVTYSLPSPFLFFATQNPGEHIGTYPLPESQLDRFSVKLRLSYPVPEKEKDIFREAKLDALGGLPDGVVTAEEFLQLQAAVDAIHLSEAVVGYVARVAQASRAHPKILRGLSTRGGIAWLRVARGKAFLLGRDFVTPDDLLAVGDYALPHRIQVAAGEDAHSVVESLLNSVDVV